MNIFIYEYIYEAIFKFTMGKSKNIAISTIKSKYCSFYASELFVDCSYLFANNLCKFCRFL